MPSLRDFSTMPVQRQTEEVILTAEFEDDLFDLNDPSQGRRVLIWTRGKPEFVYISEGRLKSLGLVIQQLSEMTIKWDWRSEKDGDQMGFITNIV